MYQMDAMLDGVSRRGSPYDIGMKDEPKSPALPISSDWVRFGQLGPDAQALTQVVLKDHIIIYGCTKLYDLTIFVDELRKPLQAQLCKRPIVFVGSFDEQVVTVLRANFDEIYFASSSGNVQVDSRVCQVSEAFSISILGNHGMNFTSMSSVGEQSDGQADDSDTLFIYLQMAEFMRPSTHICIEVSDIQSMGVFSANFNREATIRLREHKHAQYSHARRKNSIDAHHSRTQNLEVDRNPYHPDTLDVTKYGIYSYRDIEKIKSDAALIDFHNNTHDSKEHIKSDGGIENILYGTFNWAKNLIQRLTPPAANHTLGAYASGKISVPVLFDPFMVFAYHSVMIPSTIDRLIRGEDRQDIMSVNIPQCFAGQPFHRLFRHFIARSILVIGLYRVPLEEADTDGEGGGAALRSILQYLSVVPAPETKLRNNDKLFLLADPHRLAVVLHGLSRGQGDQVQHQDTRLGYQMTDD